MRGMWRQCLTGDIAAPIRNAIVGGPFGSDLVSRDYVPEGVPVIRGQNMGPGRWIGGEFAFVSEAKADLLSANCAKPGDIVFTQRGTLGQVALVPSAPFDRYLISQSQMKLTPDPQQADAAYLYYVFVSPAQQEYIHRGAISTGVPHTNLGHLKRTPLLLPGLNEQRDIAELLGNLDDKIDMNRRVSKTLEGMARTLFKSWFVDFDPVRAKSEGRRPSVTDVETEELFPNSFEDSGMFKIPRNWTRAALGEWVTAFSGGTPSKSDVRLWGGEIPWISPKAMKEIQPDESGESVTLRAIGNGTRLAPVGSTLVMVRGMGLHEEVRVSQARRAVAFNQDVKALVPRGIEASLLFFALLDAQQDLLGRVESSGHGTGKLASEILLAYPITMPPGSVQRVLAARFEATSAYIASVRAESRTLAELRDTLLPKLISGEIRIKDAEKLASAAL